MNIALGYIILSIDLISKSPMKKSKVGLIFTFDEFSLSRSI